ncbi:MAG: RidA family protein [Proteobacteria bacterium]|nr:RidA family protein [Pseudomonadota bacterium]
MTKTIINTKDAPQAIGAYSQAVRAGDLVFISGQIPLQPQTGEVVSGDADDAIRRVFDNFMAVCTAAGGTADNVIKLTVYLTDLSLFPRVNSIMAEYFTEPYPARAAVGVAELPKGVQVEVEGILSLAV